jgi:hypothetical protein
VALNEAYDDLGPGLHVLRAAAPVTRATTLAAAMRADLCATEEQAEAALADRSALPEVDLNALTTLQVLARRVARAERIAARTNERAVVDVGDRLAGAGAGLAIHPQTVRERASALIAARTQLAEAERALADHEVSTATLEGVPADEVEPRADGLDGAQQGAPRHGPTRRPQTSAAVRRSRALGVLVGSFGAALLLLGFDALPLWAALLVPLAASLWALRYLRPRADDDAGDREEASSLLAEVSASTEELFGARRASQDAAARLVLFGADRDRAEEELRLAERAWQDLAGADADPEDVESVVRRFDPQHAEATSLASETTGVRAAEAVVEQFRQRWAAVWDDLGQPAPDPASGEAAVDELTARVRRPIVLVGPAVHLGADLARVAPAAPVVVLEGSLSPAGEGEADAAVS